MIKIGSVFLVIGVFLGTFSALIPFAEILPKEIEDILYNRGMLSGFMFAAFGGMLITWKYIYTSSLLIGLAGGILGELLISTFNIICDVCFVTFYYFLTTFIISFIAFVVALILRLCSKQ